MRTRNRIPPRRREWRGYNGTRETGAPDPWGRWAALATYGDGVPLASMVAYACEPGFAGFLLHLSRLSAHTRNLLASHPPRLRSARRTRLKFAIPNAGRVSIQGEARPLREAGGDTRRRKHSTKNGSPIRPPSSDSKISCCSLCPTGGPLRCGICQGVHRQPGGTERSRGRPFPSVMWEIPLFN